MFFTPVADDHSRLGLATAQQGGEETVAGHWEYYERQLAGFWLSRHLKNDSFSTNSDRTIRGSWAHAFSSPLSFKEQKTCLHPAFILSTVTSLDSNSIYVYLTLSLLEQRERVLTHLHTFYLDWTRQTRDRWTQSCNTSAEEGTLPLGLVTMLFLVLLVWGCAGNTKWHISARQQRDRHQLLVGG